MAPHLWQANYFESVYIGNASNNPERGTKVKKLTTRVMIATAALMVAATTASAQTMTGTIPFEFRAGNRVMAPGTYRVEFSQALSTPIYRLSNVDSGGFAILLGQSPVYPDKTRQAEVSTKLVFARTDNTYTLTEIWSGTAYTIHGPKLGRDQTAALTEITLRPGKGE